MPVSFLLIVILYETPPHESATLRSLCASQDLTPCLQLVVIDHSSIDQSQECYDVCAAFGARLVYTHDPSNPPLSIAYNRSLDRHLADADYYVLLDQDSLIPNDFFEIAVRCARDNDKPSAMAPNIITSNKIASPCWSAFGWGISWRKPREGWLSWRVCSAITSAVCIHRRVFIDFGIRYNEDLVLYGIDTDFFKRLGERDSRFFALPLSVEHSLSFDSASLEDKASKLNQIFAANRLIYSKSGPVARQIVSFIEMALRLRYALRYRSRKFLSGAAQR